MSGSKSVLFTETASARLKPAEYIRAIRDASLSPRRLWSTYRGWQFVVREQTIKGEKRDILSETGRPRRYVYSMWHRRRAGYYSMLPNIT